MMVCPLSMIREGKKKKHCVYLLAMSGTQLSPIHLGMNSNDTFTGLTKIIFLNPKGQPLLRFPKESLKL